MNHYKIILSFLFTFLLSLPMKAEFAANSVIERLVASHDDGSNTVGYLSDGSDNTYFYSGPTNGWTSAAYFEIDVKDGALLEGDVDNCILVCLRRHKTGLADAHPTAFRVEGLFDGLDSWKPLFFSYFLFRGNLTREFSEKIPVANLWKNVVEASDYRNATADPDRMGKKLVKMRFTVISNNNNRKFESTGGNLFHEMALNAFDVLKVAKEGAFVPGFRDRFHLDDDYLTDIRDFKFYNTKGIVDPHNSVDGWNFNDADTLALRAIDGGDAIEVPTFDFITGPTKRFPYPLDPGQKRQATHTVEHILYAIPGDIVTLYPYFELPTTPKYQINYSHWYDYKTGGRLTFDPSWSTGSYELLDFLTDPSKIQITDEYGFFGGQHLNVHTYHVSTPEQWIELVGMVNKAQDKDKPVYFNIELDADLDFNGVENVPMLGNSTSWPFVYRLNGKGHAIRNLKLDYSNDGIVGLIRYSADGAVIENLKLDSGCAFTGNYNVGGVVGCHRGGSLTLRNIHTEASVVGVRTSNEQTAAGLIGFCDNRGDNPLLVENCYVGGKIGDPDNVINLSRNAALIAWWNVEKNDAPARFRNVIVDCELVGYEAKGAVSGHGDFKRYIRQKHNEEPISKDEDGTIHKGIFSFYNCYGNIDPNDQCWILSTHSERVYNEDLSVLVEAGWADHETPPMETDVAVDLDAYPYALHYSASNPQQYIKAVNAINARTDDKKVYFHITSDIDFSSCREDEVPVLGTESRPFTGFLNGKGHSFKNLRMKRDHAYVGVIGYAGDGVRVENLILDSDCRFEGKKYVALVGQHLGGSMKVCNYKTEATFIGTQQDTGVANDSEQCAAGVLGINRNKDADNIINLSDIYIGGVVGNQGDFPNARNAALIGWFENDQLASLPLSKSYLYRIVVKCQLYNPEDTNKKKYIRHRKETAAVSDDKESHDITKANFVFNACYGVIDLTDECWRTNESETVLQREGWADSQNPPMENDAPVPDGYTVRAVNNVEEYKAVVGSLGNSDDTATVCISINADLDFAGVTDVPMLGNKNHPFMGIFNGNGHIIRNLNIIFDDKTENVGLISWAGNGARVKNLIIDSSCRFEGWRNIGLIGRLSGGTITVSNVKTEATLIGYRNDGNKEHAAGAILGFCDNQNADNVLNIRNVYVGGEIGNESLGVNNGAICGWFENRKFPATYTSMSTIENVVVECILHNSDSNWKKYIRHYLPNYEFIQSDSEGYSVKANFKFKNCFGSLDPNDKCWKSYVPESVLGWNEPAMPPMAIGDPISLDEYPFLLHYSASNAAEYIQTVMTINALADRNVYFELTDDIDFSGYPSLPMLGETEATAFSGFLNGNGHTLKNLNIVRSTAEVGLIAHASDGVRIENIILDSSCKIVGQKNVGIIGSLLNGNNGKLTVKNLNSYATVMGTASGEQSAGGLIGMTPGGNSGKFCMMLENVHIGGVVGDKDSPGDEHKNGALAGWFEGRSFNADTWELSVIKNIVVDCNLFGAAKENHNKFIRNLNYSDKAEKIDDLTFLRRHIKFINCFGSPDIDPSDECWIHLWTMDERSDFPTLDGWTDNHTPGVVETDDLEKLQNNIGDREPGTVATFLFPRNPYSEKADQLELQFADEEDDEYVIAADFSQRFDIPRNLDKVRGELFEPVVSIRHIFRIRDGKKFADDVSGSVENNRKHLRRNLKIVSARGNVPFQIRLVTPVPKDNGGRSNYYYKVSEDNYAHICGMGINVLDGEDRSSIENPGFAFAEEFNGQGARKIDGVNYLTGDGGHRFYRMLALNNPAPNKHYIVQLVAKDDAGNTVNIFGSNQPLVVMEYDITFLPERGALMVNEADLYDDKKNFRRARPEFLDDNFGGVDKRPSTFIDFDEFFAINKITDNDDLKDKFVHTKSVSSSGMQQSYYKWALPWDLSDYTFGYDNRQDYNMYLLATHSEVVPYRDAAKEWTGNADGDGTGLYDRRYYRTKRQIANGEATEMQQGYFYYVNAATDPGVTARLNINELCQGSTIHVSAWISEFSKATETANLAFNFVAVLRDNIETEHPSLGLDNGERIVLHQFVTGYVPNDQRGQWLNVYYSFVPRLSDFAAGTLNSNMVDHYEIELDNNAKSSQGADYAIDDIRAYVVPPTIEAKQLAPVCGDKELRIRVASPFDTLLEMAGETEASGTDPARQLTLYYTFIDKSEYDARMYASSNPQDDYADIFKATLVQPLPDHDYNSISFKSKYSSNNPYVFNEKYQNTGEGYRLRDEDSGERYIVFENLVNESVNSGLLNAGKEYYLVMNPAYGTESPEGDIPGFFALNSECASKCVMVITPSSIVKVEGMVETAKDRLVICENTSPIIQANIMGFAKDGEPVDVKKNAVFDWFLGTVKEFKAYKDMDGNLLEEALGVFRSRYPDARDLDGINADDAKTEGREKLEQWMLDIIGRASTVIDPTHGVPLLILGQRSFIVPPVKIPEGEDDVKIYMVAVPIPLLQEEMPDNVIVCTEPTELSVTVGLKAPTLRHGFSSIDYPESLTDVPLRIGLEQIREESSDGFVMKTIEVPVRLADSPDDNVTSLGRTADMRRGEDEPVEGCIILVQSNDPEFSSLGEIDEDGEGTGVFPWVGEVTKLVADVTPDAVNYFHMRLHDDFNVKEGYWYRLRFEYVERIADAEKSDAVCEGQDLLTLKIVPKYQKWTGEENLNWNNDANWRRVSSGDISASGKTDAYAHFLTDGVRNDKTVNGHAKSYAPLDFTYIVVDQDAEAPYLYALGEADVEDDFGSSFKWPETTEPSVSAPVDYSDWPADRLGEASFWIQYDMAAMDVTPSGRGAQVGSRPWYANTCREIHFKPGATIMNQQELHYGKAWVDTELDHSRWQTLSTPLKEVYAGDFYLPSDDARQNTELFTDITFDNDLKINHRFKPAVYQRGWDKGSAVVYDLENQGFDSPRNVAIRTSWSRVFNDVTEEYGCGNGFSIKTIVDAMDNPPEGKVLFRLPKADTEYRYFSIDGNDGHPTAVSRTEGRYHRLNDTHGTLTASSAESGRYFLVGNPFMTHMDIRTFLDVNSDKLEQKYWLLTESGQIAGGLSEDGGFDVADPTDKDRAEDPTVIAPMQGFFVKTLESLQSVSLKYDESMMRRYDNRDGHSGEYLKGTTRSGEAPSLRIVAFNDGFPCSAALLRLDGEATSRCNVEVIDNRDLDIPSIVFIGGSGRALSIQSVADAEGVEVGVIADEETETKLLFSGIDEADGLMILDKADGSITPLGEGLAVTVEGAAAGRFFLTYGFPGEGVMSGIEWSVREGVLTVTDCAASGYLEVDVYDTLGRRVARHSSEGDTLSLRLGKGIYVVEMMTARDRESIKVSL